MEALTRTLKPLTRTPTAYFAAIEERWEGGSKSVSLGLYKFIDK
jgi:hypothetical protein